jgi:hypothetical protein
MDERKSSKGLGAVAAGGWSVATVKEPKWASTRASPGNSMIISMIYISFFLSRFFFNDYDERIAVKFHINLLH